MGTVLLLIYIYVFIFRRCVFIITHLYNPCNDNYVYFSPGFCNQHLIRAKCRAILPVLSAYCYPSIKTQLQNKNLWKINANFKIVLYVHRICKFVLILLGCLQKLAKLRDPNDCNVTVVLSLPLLLGKVNTIKWNRKKCLLSMEPL